MSKRSVFTSITPLPSSITRATVIDTLHSHTEMIDLNPLIEERHIIKPPSYATAEEYHCIWYEMTDRISFIPGLVRSNVTYTGCFHDLADGLQTHCYAAAGVDIKAKWSLGGSLAGEPAPPVEIGQGIPMSGLYLREDVDMKCNVFMLSFVKKTLKNAHKTLVSRLLVKAQLLEATSQNDRIIEISLNSSRSSPHMSLGSLGFPLHNGSTFSQTPHKAQSPHPPGEMPYHQPQSLPGQRYSSPGYLMDPAYQNANHAHQQQMQRAKASFQPSELDSQDASSYHSQHQNCQQTDSKYSLEKSGSSLQQQPSEPVELDATNGGKIS
ncbi:MAG: hypothetical protein M1818_006805 [Claussenomyces sp. TS43310]|nr:MAG: hypothetical protein M1818_006805 [Claussenomyces sp. TS43310]